MVAAAALAAGRCSCLARALISSTASESRIRTVLAISDTFILKVPYGNISALSGRRQEKFMPKSEDKSPAKDTFGERLRFLRKKRGLSQGELAKKIGYKGSNAISKIESDSLPPNIQVLNKIAEALDDDLHWLITGKPAPSAQEIISARDDLTTKLSSYVISELKRLTDMRDSQLEQKRKLEEKTPQDQIAIVSLNVSICQVKQQLDEKMKDLHWLQQSTPRNSPSA